MHATNFGLAEWCTVQERVHENGAASKREGTAIEANCATGVEC
jgi:hypothetical protein